MFIAMNRFKVTKDSTQAFETIWLERESHLERVPGFVEFHMLRGPEREDHVLYASHTVWRSKGDFEAWTRSDAFRAAHARGNTRDRAPTYVGHPEFEGFEVFQHIALPKAADAA
ncbi:antibiotic biosynthesis monooxygenase [Aurantimonas sp. Leaf443]|uniref:antibiotic biosynthesis monooxygenase family protein n=1 Tax=Aurantimonas sp. Leaf443 TaxID=1736378 RepID=UPI0006F84893|nr:antibiotic biosynthesis monooxygenase [Aurantimonas sp. Leaf443]KQT86591.1 antibiotic biosynthesis monooxygenase [Aurantimonas sp. Leaf443]